jgi:polysaccharide deacetylase family protein (PEP-CTERM system associated)
MTRHFFTVDVEEYFQVAALEPFVARARWPELPSRIERGVERLLELLERHDAQATFFTLGCVGERSPQVVRQIAAAGHEIASHGWTHTRVNALSPQQFREEVARSRDLLSGLAGRPVLGFRAPNFSIHMGCEWAFDILLEEGYRYDSSVFPSRQARAATRARSSHWVRGEGGLLEIPLPSVAFGGLRLPSGGGAWFRLLPYALCARALRQAAGRGEAGVFYIHPWELDHEQPAFPVDPLTRVRHYGGLQRTVPRLRRLLTEFRFGSIDQQLEDLMRTPVVAKT